MIVHSKEEIEAIIKKHWSGVIEFPITFGEEKVAHGSDNILFSDASGSSYIFRIIFFTVDEVHNGSQIYERLANSGIKTAHPVKTNNSEYSVPGNVENRNSSYVIHTMIFGDEEFEMSLYTPDLVEHFGEELGKFHKTLLDIKVDTLDIRGDNTKYVELYLEYPATFRDYLPDNPLAKEMYNVWNSWKSKMNWKTLTSGLIHGDIGPGCNMMVHKEEVSGFIDLIGVAQGYYMEDIGSFGMYGGLAREERKQHWEKFREGYLRTGPLSVEEMDLFPYFLLRRFILQVLYFNWRLSIGYEQGNDETENNETGLQDGYDMLEFWKKRYEHLIH